MTPDETGREDLMKEAVSLVTRIEFQRPAHRDPVLLGFNAQGWLSVYLGSDPMYRFDEQGRLRRAFVKGMLYRTEGQTLAMMERERGRETGRSESILRRRNLSAAELESFRLRMRNELEDAIIGLRDGEITRQHPIAITGLAQQFEFALRNVLDSPEFLAPAIVRRR